MCLDLKYYHNKIVIIIFISLLYSEYRIASIVVFTLWNESYLKIWVLSTCASFNLWVSFRVKRINFFYLDYRKFWELKWQEMEVNLFYSVKKFFGN